MSTDQNSTLSIAGLKGTVESATLRLTLHTENWDPESGQWRYGWKPDVEAGLEIIVDEDSGSDGAAAPDTFWRVRPMPEDFFHSQWDDNAPEFEAWFGNDAPELEQNRIEFRGRGADGRVRVYWSSLCEGEEVIFDGWADFTGLAIQVQNPEEVARFLEEAWPALARLSPRAELERDIDYGEIMPPERRHRLLYRLNW